MKPQFFLPAVTAVIGFAAAWALKPAPASVVGGGSDAPANTPGHSRPVRTDEGKRPDRPGGDRAVSDSGSQFPLADKYASGPKTTEEAKMLRLAEALGLSIDQQASLASLMEKVQGSASESGSVVGDLTKRGKMIEEGLLALLSPEQLAKFNEIRGRQAENRTETRAQQMIGMAMGIDLSPEQRDQILDNLRQKARIDLQSIPDAATLLLDKSLLPMSQKEMSIEGVLMLAKMSEPVELMDAEKAHQKVLDSQKAELEEMLRCFEGILSPAQMGQYQALVNEQRERMKHVPRTPTKTPEGDEIQGVPLQGVPEILPDEGLEDGEPE